MLEGVKDDTEVYKQFVESPSSKRFVSNMVSGLAYDARPSP